MVYCTRCGSLNPDSATTCSNCGAPIVKEESSMPYSRYEQRRYYREQYRHHRSGAGIGWLIAGIVIILVGLAALTSFNFWAYIWPIILVIIGVWVLSLGLRRNRRIRQAPPP